MDKAIVAAPFGQLHAGVVRVGQIPKEFLRKAILGDQFDAFLQIGFLRHRHVLPDDERSNTLIDFEGGLSVRVSTKKRLEHPKQQVGFDLRNEREELSGLFGEHAAQLLAPREVARVRLVSLLVKFVE